MDLVVVGTGVTKPRAELVSVVDPVPHSLYHGKGKQAPRICTGAEILQECRNQHALPAIAFSDFFREVCHGVFDLWEPVDVDGLN